MRSFLIAPLVLVMTLGLAACDSAEQRAEKHFQSAVTLLKAGKMAQARVEFLNVFKLKPDYPEARLALASALRKAGDLPGAWQQYKNVVDQHPDNAPATLAISELALEFQRWDDAERYAKQLETMDVDPDRKASVQDILAYRKAVLDKDPAAREKQANNLIALEQRGVDSPALLLVLSDWYNFQNQPQKMLTSVESLIKLAPDMPQYYLMRIAILQKLGRDQQVVTAMRDAIVKFPDNDKLLQSYIGLQISRGNYDDVEKFLNEQIANEALPEKKRVALQATLIQFLDKYRGHDAALAAAEEAIKANKNPDLFHAIHGRLLFETGERDKGMAELEGVLKTAEPTGQTQRIRLDLARMQIQTGNKVGARAQVEQVLSEDPQMVPALKMKAVFLIDGDNADQAIVLLRQAQQQAPNDPQLATLLAKAYERNGDRDLMGNMLALAVQYSDQAPAETIALARYLIGEQRYLPAEDALIQALRKQPKNLGLLDLLGRDYVLAKRFGEAKGVITRLRAIGGDKAGSAADALEVMALRAQNRSGEVANILDNLSSETSDATRSALLSVKASLVRNDFDGAKKTIETALAKTPDDPALLYAKGILELSQGHADQARAILQTVVAKQPGATKAWMAISNTYVDDGDIPGAIKILDQGIAAAPKSAQLQLQKARLLEKTGDVDAATKIYLGLYDENTSSVIMANNLASMLASYTDDPGKLEEAYKIARRLRGLPHPAFQDTYGWIAFRRGQTDEALQNLEPAAQRLTSDPLVQYHLGRVYEELGRYADAEAQYKKAAEILGAATNKGAPDLKERLAAVTAEAAKQKQE